MCETGGKIESRNIKRMTGCKIPVIAGVLSTDAINVDAMKEAKGRGDPRPNFDPWFVTGYSDAESCFSINVGDSISFNFRITAHETDKELLVSVGNYLECGTVKKNETNKC